MNDLLKQIELTEKILDSCSMECEHCVYIMYHGYTDTPYCLIYKELQELKERISYERSKHNS